MSQQQTTVVATETPNTTTQTITLSGVLALGKDLFKRLLDNKLLNAPVSKKTNDTLFKSGRVYLNYDRFPVKATARHLIAHAIEIYAAKPAIDAEGNTGRIDPAEVFAFLHQVSEMMLENRAKFKNDAELVNFVLAQLINPSEELIEARAKLAADFMITVDYVKDMSFKSSSGTEAQTIDRVFVFAQKY